MKILYAALAVALGLGGAIGLNSLFQGGSNPATALSAKAPIPPEAAGALASYVTYQKALLPSVFPQSPGAGLPAPEYRIAGAGCVIALEVQSWSWRADAEAAMAEAYREMMTEMDEGAASEAPKSPFPGTAQEGERILTHSFEKFDLRNFNLDAVRRKEAEGFVIGIASAVQIDEGDGSTNRALVDVMVSQAGTPEQADAARKFGKFGAMKFSLPFGDSTDPRWTATKETFVALRDAALRDDRISNITMGVSSSVLADGTRTIMSGGLKQPRHFPIYAYNLDDFEKLLNNLRHYKNGNCR